MAKDDTGQYSAIPQPSAIPSIEPDEYTLQEELRLSPTKQRELDHRRLVKRLEGHMDIIRNERDEALAELKGVRADLLALAEIRERDRGRRVSMGLGAIAITVGAIFIGMGASPNGHAWAFWLGWGLVTPSLIQQGLRSVLNTP